MLPNKKINLLIAAFFALAFFIVFKTFQDYGVTWDEEHHQMYGTLLIQWYQSFFKDAVAVQHGFLIFYGGFFDALVWLAHYISPWGPYETRHFLNALFGLWTVFMSFKIAEYIAGYLAGFFSALFLFFHPVFYGHMFNNPVDIPFGALLLTTFYGIVLTSDNLPRLSFKDLFKIGLPLGLALAIRISGIFIVLPCLAVCWLLWLGSRWLQTEKFTAVYLQQILRSFARNFGWLITIAWPIMLLWWPWAQLNPLTHPFIAAIKAARWSLNPSDMTVFFEGEYYKFSEAPKSYLLKSILITLPEFFFIVLLLGTAIAGFWMVKNRKLTVKPIKIIFLIFACIFPILAAVLLDAPQFDGFRHFLFVIPLLAILGGISLATFAHLKIASGLKTLIFLTVIFSLSLTAYDMRRLHPYQTVYFNRLLAGGFAEAAKKYDTDYWGNSYREGILWVIRNYHPDSKRKIRIANASRPFQTGYYLEQTPELQNRFEMVETDPDIFLSTTRWENYKTFPGKILYKVERDHAPLLYVIEVTKNTPPLSEANL